MYLRWVLILILRGVLLIFQLLAFFPFPISWILFRITGKGNWFCPIKYENGKQKSNAPNGQNHKSVTPRWLKWLGLYYGKSFHYLICFAWCVFRNPIEWFWKYIHTKKGEPVHISFYKSAETLSFYTPPSSHHSHYGTMRGKYAIKETKYFLYAKASKWFQIHIGWYPNGRHVIELKGWAQVVLWAAVAGIISCIIF